MPHPPIDPASPFAAAVERFRAGDVAAAGALCRTILQARPGNARSLHMLGVIALAEGRHAEAADLIAAAIAGDATVADYHQDLGSALAALNLKQEAKASYRTALALEPARPDAHVYLGITLLSLGEFAEGWREYEWRWQPGEQPLARRDFRQPQWRGQPIEGRTLLLHAEQGLGDTLQFCRFAASVAERGARVVLEVQQPLFRLLHGLAGADRVVTRGAKLPDFDLHCPLLSLPLALGTTPATIPAAPRYLRADPALAERMRERLTAVAGRGPHVGIAWAGDPRLRIDHRRSIPPARLAPLFAVAGITMASLQKGGPPAPADAKLIDLMPQVVDFADTAALIENLDLVISVDTAVAHLAAALGKPVWLLDRFDHCWRWLAGRRDSPWYPTLRIYRQMQPGDWAPAIAEVARDLRDLARAA